jgi:hypothetical protein
LFEVYVIINTLHKGDKEDNNNNNNNNNNYAENIWATYRENTKSRNYSKQPYWALHTHCGKC